MFCLDIESKRTADSKHEMNAWTPRFHTTLTFALIGQTPAVLPSDWLAPHHVPGAQARSLSCCRSLDRAGDRLQADRPSWAWP